MDLPPITPLQSQQNSISALAELALHCSAPRLGVNNRPA